MTASLFPVAMLIVFIIMGVVFCYEPKAETDATRFLAPRAGADNEAQAETESAPLTVARATE